MVGIASIETMAAEQDREISQTVLRERGRLRNFIRRRVADESDVEDILQDVFGELLEAIRLTQPIEQISAWLFRVARNRIIDLFRKKKPLPLQALVPVNLDAHDEIGALADLLPSPEAGPEAAYARRVMLEELDAALDELPDEQRDVFIAHEIEGRRFKELSHETGIGINTLLSRKRYAVLYLRKRLIDIIDEFGRRSGDKEE